jgi:hypothetical protein
MMMIIQLLKICRNPHLLIMCTRINMLIKLTILLDQWLDKIHNMMFQSPRILCISIIRDRNIRNLCQLVVLDVLIEKIKNHLFLVLVHQNLNQLLQISIMKHLKKNLPLVFFQTQYAFLRLNLMEKILRKYEFMMEISQLKLWTNFQINSTCLIMQNTGYWSKFTIK